MCLQNKVEVVHDISSRTKFRDIIRNMIRENLLMKVDQNKRTQYHPYIIFV